MASGTVGLLCLCLLSLSSSGAEGKGPECVAPTANELGPGVAVRVSPDGRVARFRCVAEAAGHRLVGRRVAMCFKSGWSHPPPICQMRHDPSEAQGSDRYVVESGSTTAASSDSSRRNSRTYKKGSSATSKLIRSLHNSAAIDDDEEERDAEDAANDATEEVDDDTTDEDTDEGEEEDEDTEDDEDNTAEDDSDDAEDDAEDDDEDEDGGDSKTEEEEEDPDIPDSDDPEIEEDPRTRNKETVDQSVTTSTTPTTTTKIPEDSSVETVAANQLEKNPVMNRQETAEEDADNEIPTVPDLDHMVNSIQKSYLQQVNVSLLDLSCASDTNLPNISNAFVTKYGRSRAATSPFNLFAQLVFACQEGFALDPAKPDRLFCSNQQWIGNPPHCLPTSSVQQESESKPQPEPDHQPDHQTSLLPDPQPDNLQSHQSNHQLDPKPDPQPEHKPDSHLHPSHNPQSNHLLSEYSNHLPKNLDPDQDLGSHPDQENELVKDLILDVENELEADLKIDRGEDQQPDLFENQKSDNGLDESDIRKDQDNDQDMNEVVEENSDLEINLLPDQGQDQVEKTEMKNEMDKEANQISDETTEQDIEPSSERPPVQETAQSQRGSPTPTPPTSPVVSASGDDRSACGEDRGGCQQVCQVIETTNSTIGTRCSCFRGFKIDADGRSCSDINECLVDNGGCDGQCTNRPGGYFCSCSTGFRLASNGKKCIDNNECSLRNGHGPCQGTCRNTYGSYECSCLAMVGTQLAADGHSCEDIDECAADGNNFGCSHSCLNTLGTAFCACPEGYMLGADWKTCEDIDECDYEADDDGDQVCPGICRNTIGSFICIDVDEVPEGVDCPSGFQPEFGECKDINECEEDNGGCSHLCVNEQGSHTCLCPTGFQLNHSNNVTCQDVDECDEENGGCSQRCVNVAGSYHCDCADGYELLADGLNCGDVDECLRNACPMPALCQNVPGSFVCHCPAGFVMEDNRCYDVDECQVSPSLCGPGVCVNQDGAYTCLCHLGYEFRNGTCQDVNECLLDACITGRCENTAGSFNCICDPGLVLEGNVCVDLDECLRAPCTNGSCINLVGSYRCQCSDGFISEGDACYDVDECLSNPCVNGECINTDGDYFCRCQSGYKALGNLCLDIDECESISCLNGDCINTQGSYQCQCLPGYYLEGNKCLDVDECQWNPCINGSCENLDGSYRCTCPMGFVFDSASNTCLDENECDKKNGGCAHMCRNTPGKYVCLCHPGFQLAADGQDCTMIPPVILSCPAIEPPEGGYLHCSNRPGDDLTYKSGTSCRLRCRKGYMFQRHKPVPEVAWSWQNQVVDGPSTSVVNENNNLGLSILQGWKPTHVWHSLDWNQPQPQAAVGRNASTHVFSTPRPVQPIRKKLKVSAERTEDRKRENEKRHLVLGVGEGPSSQLTPGPSRPHQNQTLASRHRQHKKSAGGRRQRFRRQNRLLNLPKGPLRRCGDDGKWKGKLGFCKPLNCPPLAPPANGSVSPASCGTGEAAPNQHCYFTCNPGFRVSGNPVRVCLPSLKWNPQRPPPSCEKVAVKLAGEALTAGPAWGAKATPNPPASSTERHFKNAKHHGSDHMNRNFIYLTYVYPWPRIDCPRDMLIELPIGARSVDVIIPQPATNVDWNSHVEAEPSWAKKLRAELGPTRMVVSFRARNPVTEYTAICSFLLEVRDREPPVVRDCPHDVHVRLGTLEPYVTATWFEPSFSDNIAVTHVIKSKEPGSLFALGDSIVSYVASDASGNSARCEFTVSVSPALVSSELARGETCPRLEAPLNGDLNCLSWTWGQLCRPSCPTGHVFFRPLPSAVYLCGRDRRWKPGTILPDCSPTSVVPEGGCNEGWEERRTGNKLCVGCAPGLYRPLNSTVCIPCPMGTYQDNFSAASCKSCPKKLTTCAMGTRQCTSCKSPEECTPVAHVTNHGSAITTTTQRPLSKRLRPLHRRRQRPDIWRRRISTTTAPSTALA